MKTPILAIATFLSASFSLSAQVASAVASQPAYAPYQAVAADGNSTVWERADAVAAGAIAPQKHSYVQLEAGMNHLVNGRWVPSSENIEIMPDGTAAATNGQHQAYFPADIYESALTVVTPGGQILQSRPALLIYTDGNGVEAIGKLKSSLGELAASNQVVYPDAFAGIKADIRFTYTKGGIEQDIILRQQPPAPETLGLDPAKTRLEVMTEFFDPPAPELNDGVVDPVNKMQDTRIKLGGMTMALGKAFSTADANQKAVEGASVFKDWLTTQGRTFLVEKLPYQAIARQLQNLPLQASLTKPSSSIKLALGGSTINALLPPARPVKSSTGQVLLAKADYSHTPGVVLDYVLLNGAISGPFTFQADTTYRMSGSYFEIDGLVTFEGGSVIKFDSSTAGFQLINGGIVCQTGPYRPLIMTAKDDDTVGEIISGSTGTPSGYYGSGITIQEYGYVTLHDIRMSYLAQGFFFWTGVNFNNLQVINCNSAYTHAFADSTINNALFYNIGNVAVQTYGSASSVSGTQLTIDNCATFADSSTLSLTLANCLVTATTNLLAGTGTLTTNAVTVLAGNAGIYQTVGAGTHYLANGSPYRNVGTNTINATVLASLAARTTYPPLIFSNQTFTVSTNLPSQAKRDTNASPDLGYHYDSLDYITDNLTVTNSTLTITNGIAIACYNEPGIILQAGSALVSTGTPLLPNWLVHYQSVQDASVFLGGSTAGSGQNVTAAALVANRPNATFQFTHFATPANGGFVFKHNANNAFNNLTVQHSELWGGTNDFSGPTNAASAILFNNLFYRSGVTAVGASSAATLAFTNNAIYGTVLSLAQPAAVNWYFFNNDVDSCIVAASSVITNGYNAFINCSTNLIGTANYVSTNAIGYQTGPLGIFYQPTNSSLIDLGTGTAVSLTLGHFTTLTNQTIESNSIVDIGYHYVALGTNGLPLTDTNGIPFYVKDGNPNQAPIIQVQPANYTAVLSNTASFTVTAAGSAPLKYQWRFNTNTVVPGATNATLSLSNVQTTNAGNYTVIITNTYGAVTSSIAVLTVVTKPVITVQPVNDTANLGDTATFGVTAIGVAPLRYQWRFNTNNVLVGATNATLTLNNVQATNAGSYSVIVTNKYGAVTSSPAILTVLLPPTIALASPVNGQLFPVYPTNLTLTATAGDPDGTVASVTYYSGTTSLSGALTVSPYTFTWTNVTIGAYQISAVATDNSGLSTTSAVANIIVDAPPTAAITSPAGGLVINGATNLAVSASAADADGSVTQLQIFAGPVLLGTSATSPYSLVWSNVPSGLWNLAAVAFDNYGVGTTSSVVSLTVNNNTNFLPAIADTYVRDGIYTNLNFGTNTTIEVKNNSGAPTNGLNRIAYFKFDVSSMAANIGSAKLVVFSSLNTTGLVTNAVFSVTNTGWDENLICWSNKPVRVTALSSNILNGTNGAWYQYEVTSYVKSQVAAGRPLVALSLYVPNLNGLLTTINSRENASNNPYLYLVLTNPPPTVSLISPTNNAILTVYSNLVSATASGSNGISQVNFYQGTTLFGTDFVPPYNVYWNNSATGTFTLKAVAIDNAGLTATSSISVTVPIVDSDADGLPDWFESGVSMTDPFNADTDGNGISDANEYVNATGLTWLQYYQLTNNPQTVATPVVSSVGYAARAVTLTCSTPGATIYYTTNGLSPTTSSPHLYSGQAIWISSPVILKTMAGKAGMVSSSSTSKFMMVGKVVEGYSGRVHALKNDGTVWSWGDANYGTLGDVNRGCSGLSPQTTPVQVRITGGGVIIPQYLTNIIDIAAGDAHVLALQDDGTVWLWGSFNYSDSTCASTAFNPAKVTIPAGAKVIQVAAGPLHASILRADGTVWYWKYGNSPAQISAGGHPLTNVVSITGGRQAVSGTSSFTIALKSDGTIWSSILGGSATQIVHSPQTDVPTVSISPGNYLTFCLRSDGIPFDFTDGVNGANGLFEYEADQNLSQSNVTMCVGGNLEASPWDAFAFTMKGDGSLWTLLTDDTYSISGPGTIYTNYYGYAVGRWIPQSNNFFGGLPAVEIWAQWQNCMVLAQDGSLWAWGDNSVGELGNGTSGGFSRTPAQVNLNLLTNIVQNTNDSSGDGIPDWQKLLLGFSTNNAYSNGDGLWDTISMTVGINPLSPDVDGEGLSNTNEALIGTDPFLPDTDGDGVNDLLDPFPLDPTRSTSPALNPTIPAVNVIVPINVTPY